MDNHEKLQFDGIIGGNSDWKARQKAQWGLVGSLAFVSFLSNHVKDFPVALCTSFFRSYMYMCNKNILKEIVNNNHCDEYPMEKHLINEPVPGYKGYKLCNHNQYGRYILFLLGNIRDLDHLANPVVVISDLIAVGNTDQLYDLLYYVIRSVADNSSPNNTDAVQCIKRFITNYQDYFSGGNKDMRGFISNLIRQIIDRYVVFHSKESFLRFKWTVSNEILERYIKNFPHIFPDVHARLSMEFCEKFLTNNPWFLPDVYKELPEECIKIFVTKNHKYLEFVFNKRVVSLEFREKFVRDHPKYFRIVYGTLSKKFREEFVRDHPEIFLRAGGFVSKEFRRKFVRELGMDRILEFCEKYIAQNPGCFAKYQKNLSNKFREQFVEEHPWYFTMGHKSLFDIL